MQVSSNNQQEYCIKKEKKKQNSYIIIAIRIQFKSKTFNKDLQMRDRIKEALRILHFEG